MPHKSMEVSVEPKVLIWARESIGRNIEEVAKKLNISEDTVTKWETGKKRPAFIQIEKLATLYKRPLVAFLLTEPPQELPTPNDFRTELSIKHKPLTPKTLLIIRKARRFQASAVELNKELGNQIRPFSMRTALSDKPEIVAERVIAEIISTDFNISRFSNSEEAFKGWKRILEENGILVFQINIQQREIKGFSIIEGGLPAIIVNKSDEANSKIFSLFHELAHILLNRSGICDMVEDARSLPIEKFCNHFAGAFLVPPEKLLNTTLVRQNKHTDIWDNKTLKIIADEFRVSREVILRRLLMLGRTSGQFYKKWRAENVREYRPFGRGGRNPVKACVEERGKKYVSMVFKAYDQAKISVLDTADYLGVKIDQIPKVHEMLSK
jgi:Zn-dependent peptidase ImmA (M78 family)/DNA-binding XRE family transcriptional regulator